MWPNFLITFIPLVLLLYIIFLGQPFNSCVCQKTTHTQQLQNYFPSLWIILCSSLPMLNHCQQRSEAAVRRVPLLWTAVSNSAYLPDPEWVFHATFWSVWDCCWSEKEAVQGLSWQQRCLSLPLCLNCSSCSRPTSEQLVFQSKWILLQSDLFWKLGTLSNVYVLGPLGIWTIS